MAGRASGVKMGDEGGGSLISPDGVAPIRIVRVSASVVSPCTIKSRRRFLLIPAHTDSPGKRTIKRLCLCVRLRNQWKKKIKGNPSSPEKRIPTQCVLFG